MYGVDTFLPSWYFYLKNRFNVIQGHDRQLLFYWEEKVFQVFPLAEAPNFSNPFRNIPFRSHISVHSVNNPQTVTVPHWFPLQVHRIVDRTQSHANDAKQIAVVRATIHLQRRKCLEIFPRSVTVIRKASQKTYHVAWTPDHALMPTSALVYHQSLWYSWTLSWRHANVQQLSNTGPRINLAHLFYSICTASRWLCVDVYS